MKIKTAIGRIIEFIECKANHLVMIGFLIILGTAFATYPPLMQQGFPKNTSVQWEEMERDLINLNTATAEQLMLLPGIGEKKAAAILAYRQDYGAFDTIEEVKQVNGIADSVFASIADMICI